MLKTVFFKEEDQFELADRVNEFIKDKVVINVSYSVASCVYGYIHCCCVLYNTLG